MGEKSSAKPQSADASDREIVISRLVDAPRELVWEAMTNPKHVVKWWGPRGFSTTIEEMDVRPGGVWKQVMQGPDGTNYPNRSEFKEVVKPERIVYALGGGKAGGREVHFVSTWTFDERAGDKTQVTIHMVFTNPSDRDFVVKEHGAIEGGRQTLGRLNEEVTKLLPESPAGLLAKGEKSDEREFVISRLLDAPRELVFKAWTDPTHMARWWGPHGFTNPVCELDVRPGGTWRILMRGPDGSDHPCKGVYREIAPPQRLVMTVDHSELPEEWHDMINPGRDRIKGRPKIEGVITVTFDDADGKTRLAVSVVFESPAVKDSLLKIGMNEGWSQSLERLAAVVTAK